MQNQLGQKGLRRRRTMNLFVAGPIATVIVEAADVAQAFSILADERRMTWVFFALGKLTSKTVLR